MWSQNSVKRKPVYDTAIFLSYSKKKYKTLFSIIWFFLTDLSISLITLVPRVSWNRICLILRRNNNLACPALLLIKKIKKYRDSKLITAVNGVQNINRLFHACVLWTTWDAFTLTKRSRYHYISLHPIPTRKWMIQLYFPNRWFLCFFVQQSFVRWRARRKVNWRVHFYIARIALSRFPLIKNDRFVNSPSQYQRKCIEDSMTHK